MLWHFIARDTGRSVEEAKATITVFERNRWAAFYEKYPPHQPRLI